MPKSRDPVASRRRGLLLATLVLLLIGGSIVAAVSESVSVVNVGALAVLAALLGARTTTSFRIGGRDPALDDELTRANRAKAALAGFGAAMAAAIGALIASYFTSLQSTQAALLVLVAGAAAAGLRFGLLEARLD